MALSIQAITDYYDDQKYSGPFAPFFVAPFGVHQDSVVIGPYSITKFHDAFINSLYGPIESSKNVNPIYRVFPYRGQICVSVTLTTVKTDEVGRPRLRLTLGFLIKDADFRDKPAMMGSYLTLLFSTINKIFNLSLPDKGSGVLLDKLRGQEGEAEQRMFFLNLSAVFDALLLASETAGAMNGRKHSFMWRFMSVFTKKRRLPKIIFIPQDADSKQITSLLLAEVGTSIARKGFAATYRELEESTTGGVTVISLRRFPAELENASHVKMRQVNGKSYIALY